MAEMVYAVHTRACTYLLDEEGVCGWVLSPSGDQAPDRCIGAQFVACLDLREEGGLVGELRVGASGLFARREGGRFVLLKTSVIERVDYRWAGDYRRQGEVTMTSVLTQAPQPYAAEGGPDTLRMQEREGAHPPVEQPPAVDPHAAYAQPAHADYPAQAPGWPSLEQYIDRNEPSTGPMPPGYTDTGAEEYAPVASGDLEEISTFSSAVTLNLPLYRHDPDDPPPQWDGSPAPSPYGWPSDDEGWHRR